MRKCYFFGALAVAAVAIVACTGQAEQQKPQGLVIEAYVAVVESIGSKVWDNRIAESQHQTENTLVSTIPMWHLECLPDEEAARLCHETITNQGI